MSPRRLALVLVTALVLAAGPACQRRSADERAKDIARPNPDATGEVFVAGDRAAMQGFRQGQLAAGGGWVYWVNQPRIDRFGLGKEVIQRKRADGGTVETIGQPGTVRALAADASAIYWADDHAIWSRPHRGGPPVQLANHRAFEIVTGDHDLLLLANARLARLPKAGGTPVILRDEQRGYAHAVADGDRFLVSEQVRPHGEPARGAITAFAPGADPVVLSTGMPTGAIALSGAYAVFSGGAGPVASLWRVDKRRGGQAEQVGQPTWGFGAFLVRGDALYGMVFTGRWALQKVPLSGGAPVTLDGLRTFHGMVLALAADERFLYYLTDFDVKRVPL